MCELLECAIDRNKIDMIKYRKLYRKKQIMLLKYLAAEPYFTNKIKVREQKIPQIVFLTKIITEQAFIYACFICRYEK